ncbi:alpha/beta fold hydrolase [Pedobacter nutrimenti]|uniref:Pimeloyl-ACP methyl ester carboxylesterase n=1 Tax=Pedobacter nutrimenti TaxID=1241337 RepID=A0A318UCN0_9SPHI|nr:alpha/beta hydrolase [Pedobacter nutrimenti]PYF74134.1 pimeloyl-ACP methyl ester carboxylesterase [Pedobacter nutrimenti]
MKRNLLINTLLVFIFIFTGHLLSAQTPGTKAFQVKVSGKGSPILFIPGATCSGEVWKETVARYQKNHECHVFTLAGYAGTEPLAQGPYLESYKKEIIRYIKDKKLNKVVLVGHSIGGFLSLCIAAEMKDHLQKVVVVDALPFYAAMFNPAAKAGFNETQAQSMLEAYKKMDKAALKASQLNVARSLCADSTKWDNIAQWGADSDLKTMAWTMNEMLGNDLRQDIATIKVPVLVLAAFAPVKKYPMFTREFVMNSYSQQYQQCKSCEVKVSPSAKHFIMYDAPDWFYQEMDTFISKG